MIIAFGAALGVCQATTPLPPNTPLKAYEKEVIARMNVVWSRLSSQYIDGPAVGTIKVHFHVEPDGRVSHLKIVSNTGNLAFVALATRTVQETQIPPIPCAALAELPNGYMPGDCNFAIFPPR